MENNIIFEYINGTDTVTIYEDGTKVRVYDGESIPNFPETIDVKITNYCETGCPFCHENSSKQGKHADLGRLLDVLYELPAGVELAIGGGNPLSHPDLYNFLEELKEKGIICNLTINQDQLESDVLKYIMDNKLIKGIGISMTNIETFPMKHWVKTYPHAVIHVINGLISCDDILKLKDNEFKKILILGYKTFGKGIKYIEENEGVNRIMKKNYIHLPRTFKDMVISFDNLAIEQLNVRRFFSEEGWSKFYMGDDFTHSMYIDAVREEYGESSRIPYNERVSFEQKSLINFFKYENKN